MKSNIIIFKYNFGTEEEFYTPQFITLDEVVDFIDKVVEDNDLKFFEINYPEEDSTGFSVELGSMRIRCERIYSPSPEDFCGKELFSSFPWTRVETLVKKIGVKREKVIDNFEDFLKVVKKYEAAREAGLEPIDEF